MGDAGPSTEAGKERVDERPTPTMLTALEQMMNYQRELSEQQRIRDEMMLAILQRMDVGGSTARSQPVSTTATSVAPTAEITGKVSKILPALAKFSGEVKKYREWRFDAYGKCKNL